MPKATPKPIADSCRSCASRMRSNWRSLSEAELERLDRARCVVRCDTGEALFEQGDPSVGVYCVKSGMVAVRRLDDEGNEVTLALGYTGDLIGYHALVDGSEHQTSAKALGPATVCVIDGATVTDAMGRNPELARDTLRRAAGELQKAQDALVRAATLPPRTRLMLLLLQLLERHGETCADGSCRLELPLPRRDLASMVGVRHETLSRIIARLEAEGLARFNGRRVTVPSHRALVTAASPTA
jgi:CRP/FNR family transcriptional regulator